MLPEFSSTIASLISKSTALKMSFLDGFSSSNSIVSVASKLKALRSGVISSWYRLGLICSYSRLAVFIVLVYRDDRYRASISLIDKIANIRYNLHVLQGKLQRFILNYDRLECND